MESAVACRHALVCGPGKWHDADMVASQQALRTRRRLK